MFNAIIIHQNKNKIFEQILISWAENREWMYRVFIKYCVFSKDFKIFQTLASRCQCVYTHQAGKKPAIQQNWQSSEKSQNLKEKTQYLMNTLYISGEVRTKRRCAFWNISRIFRQKIRDMCPKGCPFRSYLPVSFDHIHCFKGLRPIKLTDICIF